MLGQEGRSEEQGRKMLVKHEECDEGLAAEAAEERASLKGAKTVWAGRDRNLHQLRGTRHHRALAVV